MVEQTVQDNNPSLEMPLEVEEYHSDGDDQFASLAVKEEISEQITTDKQQDTQPES